MNKKEEQIAQNRAIIV